jgi:hypothetical protein
MLNRLVLIIVFALLGAAVWAVPPHAMGRVTRHHPETTWPWLGDALESCVFEVSLPLLFVLGAAYGPLDPKRYWIAFLAAWWICPFDMALDLAQYPTSHNLWPIGLVFWAVICLPALIGAWLGRLLGPKLRPHSDLVSP